MNVLSISKSLLTMLIAAMLVLPFLAMVEPSRSYSSSTIELEDFHWTRFPLKVLVEMNQWAVPDYAVAVREALDSWVKSIWNYSQTYNDTSLNVVNYLLYVSDVNSTVSYDVVISFNPTKIPPGSNTVGLTTYRWETTTHEPIPPININITTFSATASNLFVKNVAMHEFGHALGLGHASSSSTSNGPELMYYTSSKNQIVYPSSLDVYGLTELYRGAYDQISQLPPGMPYVMLTEGDVPLPTIGILDDYTKYLPIIALLILLIAVAVILGQVGKQKPPQVFAEAPPPMASSNGASSTGSRSLH